MSLRWHPEAAGTSGRYLHLLRKARKVHGILGQNVLITGFPAFQTCVRRKYMRIFEQIFLQTRQKFANMLSYGKNF